MLGEPRRHLEVCASTNDEAFCWIEQGAPHGAVVTADRQTAGRGRMGRTWVSEHSDDVYASVILRPGALAHTPGALALAVGVGIREGLAEVCGAESIGSRFELKWPNDVWLDRKKVAGILCEARWSGQVPTIVVGFGINVGRTNFPPQLRDQATSLALGLDEAPDRDAVLDAVLGQLDRALEGFFGSGFAAVREAYERHCPVLDAEIMIPDGTGKRAARALRLDHDGALIVEHSGAEHRVDQADVWLGRTPG